MTKKVKIKLMTMSSVLMIVSMFCSQNVLGQNTKKGQTAKHSIELSDGKVSDTLYYQVVPTEDAKAIIHSLLDKKILTDNYLYVSPIRDEDSVIRTTRILLVKKNSEKGDELHARFFAEHEKLKQEHKSKVQNNEFVTEDYNEMQSWVKKELDEGYRIAFMKYDKETGKYSASSFRGTKSTEK